jgi:uncharacterized protein (DUF697 family)/GTP-binding protein EngB required for normal cell division
MAQGSSDWFRRQFAAKFDEQAEKIGRFNLAIFGKTGVGKSTLINAIFGEDLAETGIGEPVTRDSHLYMHHSGHFGVLDTRGLEIGQDNDAILDDLRSYVRQMRRLDLKDQVHVAWYCVRASDRRFEETEAAFIRALDDLGLPVLLVLTQVPKRKDDYHPDAVRLAGEIADLDLPITGGTAFMTYAKADDFAGFDAHGLQDVLDATFQVAPQGVQQALVAAQQIDFSRKRAEAKRSIEIASTAAAAAGATPIPFSDAAILVPIQLTMMASISHIYDINLDRAVTASLAATAAATTAGRSAVGNLLKMVPGVGSMVGGVINASIATGFTWSMGQAWTVVCMRLAKGGLVRADGVLDSEAIRSLFMSEFTETARSRLTGGGSPQSA